MRLAETVTFGGSSLDRAAEIRGQSADLDARLKSGAAQVIMLWRGKPLLTGDARDALMRVASDHPLVAGAKTPLILLGREGETLVFAQDISDWEPEAYDAEALNAFLDPTEQQHPAFGAACGFVELRGAMTRLSPRDAELAATARAIFGWHRSHRFCAACGVRSQMINAGWQRSCPECGTQHFPRTDPVVIMLITRGNSVLMGRSPGWPEGMFSLLAGFVEPGETLEAAVRREVYEEAHIEVGAVSYLASQPWPFPSSLMIGCAGEALSDEITIDPHEIEAARWFTREEIAQSFAGENPELKPARKGAIAHFLLWNWLADRLE